MMNKTRWNLRVVSCLLQAKMAVKNEELIDKYNIHVSMKSRKAAYKHLHLIKSQKQQGMK